MGCHLDSGFGEELLALHSNIVFSPSFEFGDPTQKPANVTEHPVGVGWVTVREAAEGTVSMTPDALHGHSALEVQYKGGTGQLGVANRGIGNEGLFLTGQKVYEGYGGSMLRLNDHLLPSWCRFFPQLSIKAKER